MNELWGYVGDIYKWILVVSLLLGLLFYKKVTVLGKYFLGYFGLLLLSELLCQVVAYFTGSNHIMLPVYCMMELGFFMCLFNMYLFKKFRVIPWIIGSVAMLYIIGELIFNFILHHVTPKNFQPYCKIADNFCIIVYCLLYLFEKMKYTQARFDNFSLTVGLLINFTISTIFFLPFNFLVNQEKALTVYFWIGNVVVLVLYACFLSFFILSPVFQKNIAARPVSSK